MKRVILGNIVVKANTNTYRIMNLVSFRRKVINELEYQVLVSIDQKMAEGAPLLETESNLYLKLVNEKQVLTHDIILDYESKLMAFAQSKMDMQARAITINITNKCNFNCIYCYQRHFYHRSERMSVGDIDALYKYIYEYLPTLGVAVCIDEILISGGEPLLHENISVVNRCIQLFETKVKTIKMFTNGLNIVDFSRRIDLDKITKYQISFDGTDEVINQVNGYHGSNAFQIIVAGIKYLAKLGKQIDVPIMATKETINKLGEFLQKLRDEGLFNYNNVHYSVICAFSIGNVNFVDEDVYKINEFILLRQRAKELAANTAINVATIQSLSILANYINRSANSKLVKEGEVLNHCVGRINYGQRVLRAESLIFFIRNKDKVDTPFVTVEYSLTSKRVLQCYGYKGSKPDDTVLDFVYKKWLPYANKRLKQIQTAA